MRSCFQSERQKGLDHSFQENGLVQYSHKNGPVHYYRQKGLVPFVEKNRSLDSDYNNGLVCFDEYYGPRLISNNGPVPFDENYYSQVHFFFKYHGGGWSTNVGVGTSTFIQRLLIRLEIMKPKTR